MESKIYNDTAYNCSKIITKSYSTSFTLGIQTLHKRFHRPVYAIYGFVRYADEIVDTFYEQDQETLLREFREATFKALEHKFSFNPVLHAFQETVHNYNIDMDLIDAFLKSMEMDLYHSRYDNRKYDEYIYGSAEVVGLMCLKVFCEGNREMYDSLKEPARSLGAAFQKVNFLRDLKDDFQDRGRVYFPGMEFNSFDKNMKSRIEGDIQNDFDAAYQGIVNLPSGARLGVYLAYIYYVQLFKKIKKCSANKIQSERIRIPDLWKMTLLVSTYFKHRFNFF